MASARDKGPEDFSVRARSGPKVGSGSLLSLNLRNVTLVAVSLTAGIFLGYSVASTVPTAQVDTALEQQLQSIAAQLDEAKAELTKSSAELALVVKERDSIKNGNAALLQFQAAVVESCNSYMDGKPLRGATKRQFCQALKDSYPEKGWEWN